ncbi:MAG: hypothetical protein K1X74_09380 [Pirellulales bacterium]|nr:hypothetical protein [Pirellulales bacterium]
MSDDETLLIKELAKAGAQGAKLGGALAGAPALDKISEAAMTWAMRHTARFMPTERLERELVLQASAAALLAKARNVLKADGRLYDGEVIDPGARQLVRGVLMVGLLNMTPAVVTVEVLEMQGYTSRVQIRTLAKEGLWFKQRIAAKALTRMEQELHDAFAFGVLLAEAA